MRQLKWIKCLFICVSISGISGCSIFGPVSAPQIIEHNISAIPGGLSKSQQRNVAILVQPVSISPLYRSTEMIYTTHKNRPKTYALNEWASPPAQMIQPLIVQSLQRTGFFKAVLFPPYVGRPHVILSTHIMRLHLDYTQPRKVLRFSVQAQLTDAKTSSVIDIRTFAVVTPIGKPSPKNAAYAANKATRQLLTQLARFTVRTLQNYDIEENK